MSTSLKRSCGKALIQHLIETVLFRNYCIISGSVTVLTKWTGHMYNLLQWSVLTKVKSLFTSAYSLPIYQQHTKDKQHHI